MSKTEITVQVFEDISDVKTKLEKLNFSLFSSISGEDFYFTTIDKNEIKNANYKDLMQKSIIIRSINYISQQKQENKLVYKNKDIKNNITVSEQKFETKIDDKESCKKILELSGQTNWISLKQTNFFYQKGEIEITIGTVEGIPYSILEIEEYPSISNFSNEEKIEKLTSLSKSLGLKLGDDFSFKKCYYLFNQK